MTPDEAAWVRDHAWTRAMRRTDTDMPGVYRMCPCQWGPCGHCTAGRHDQCTHERHPDYAARPNPEAWLMAPPGARWADYHPVWRVGTACSWTCSCLATHTRQPASEQLALI